jgi:hypothetical protein
MQLRVDLDHRGLPLPAAEVTRFEIARAGDQLLVEVDAPYYGDPAPAQEAGSTDRLWEYEVSELFIAADGDEYLELELGPHGHYLVLQLRGIRNVVQRDLPIAYSAVIEASAPRGADEQQPIGRYLGRARVPLAYLPAEPARINAYAIHGTGARRRYCVHAPTHADPPDFHRPAHFAPWRLP